jgi:acetyl-CoA C-acetyltransferase
LYEVNEAFACVPLAWLKELKADINKLNVNGGAMALGHPLGATGAKLITTLLCELERRKAKYGLLAICEGGGTANATIIERVGHSSML